MEQEIEAQKEAQQDQSTGVGQENVGETPTQVESNGSRQSAENGASEKKEKGDSQYNAFIRMLKKQDERLAMFEETLSKLSIPSQPSTPVQSNGSGLSDDIWADPDSFVTKKVKKELSEAFKEYELKSNTLKAREEANEYVYSQDDVKTEEDISQIQQIVKEYGLDVAAQVNPGKAAEAALSLWRSSRGVSTHKNSEKTSAKLQAGGVQGGSVSSGKRIWSKGEIGKISGNPQAWLANRDDIMAAYEEGRIRD